MDELVVHKIWAVVATVFIICFFTFIGTWHYFDSKKTPVPECKPGQALIWTDDGGYSKTCALVVAVEVPAPTPG